MNFKTITFLLFGFSLTSIVLGEKTSFVISGQGWAQAGKIMHATDTLDVNLNGNWYQSAGAQFTAIADIGDNWEGAFGFGGFQIHNSLGNDEQATLVRTGFQNYITEARMTYFHGDKIDPKFSVTFGNFPHNYNPDIKNLGLYLLQGPVYPGFLISGFQHSRLDTSKGDLLGMRFNQRLGFFEHELIFSNEREFSPTFDWSLGYIAKIAPLEGITLGAGVNFYRLLANNSDLTDLNLDSVMLANDNNPHGYNSLYFEIDSVKGDTTRYTHRGTKLMGMMGIDIGHFMGMRPNSFKIYAEAAVIGVLNHGTVYNNIMERLPVVLGLNIPTFGLLDFLSFEVEWYGAKYKNDIRKLTDKSLAAVPSPVPVSREEYNEKVWLNNYDDSSGYLFEWDPTANGGAGALVPAVKIVGTGLDVEELTTDDIKWSLNVQKTIQNHISFSAQIANDHYRPPTIFAGPIDERGGTAEVFTDLKDWYFMFRVGYFF